MSLDNTDYQKMKSNLSSSEVPDVETQPQNVIETAKETKERINETKDKINRFNQFAQNTINAIRNTVQFIIKGVSLIFSPHGLIAIGVTLAIWLVFMAFSVTGSQTFGSDCYSYRYRDGVAEVKEGADSEKEASKCEKLGDGSKSGRLSGEGSGGGSGDGSTVPAGGKIEALEQVLGQPIDMDGAYGAQCWDLANWYAQKLGAPGISGASGRAGYIGHEFPWDSWGFDVIKDPSPGDLKPGDIICWYPGGQFLPGVPTDPTWGHVGVIAEVKEGGVIDTYEQNAEKGQIVGRYTRQYVAGGISSVIRKKGA